MIFVIAAIVAFIVLSVNLYDKCIADIGREENLKQRKIINEKMRQARLNRNKRF